MFIQPIDYVHLVGELYAENANPKDAPFMQHYMKDHFPFFGIKKPMREMLSKEIIQQYGIPDEAALKEIARLCFQEEMREMQYFVKDLFTHVIKKLDASYLPLLESLILQKSWWDSVDFLAPKFVGKILQRYPEQIAHYPDRWIESENIWLQRSAILFQLDYKEKTDAPLLFRYITRRADSKAFFVQKAAGWALREYSKRNAEAVQHFVNTTPLPKLTVREGLKRMS
ncbi:MAG: DNA alkylation repair protein [Saprospiraceae bacterium]